MAITNNWISRASALNNNWKSVVYGDGLWVAISNQGFNSDIMTSPDGITWTIRTTPSAGGWNSITYGNGLFVAVRAGGTFTGNNTVLTSPDGVTWTLRTAFGLPWNDIHFSNGLFVAVGTGVIMTSPDGISWTSRTAPNPRSWKSVTYGNGIWVSVANQTGTDTIMTSTDSITWTERTSPNTNQWHGVTFGNGIFVAVAINGSNTIYSSDGINWNQSSPVNLPFKSVAFGNGYFVAVTGTNANSAYSENGINWTLIPNAANNEWNSVDFANNRFVSVSSSGTGNRVQTLDISDPPKLALGTEKGSLNLSWTNGSCSVLPLQSITYHYKLFKDGLMVIEQTLTNPFKFLEYQPAGDYYFTVDIIIDESTICESLTSNTVTLLPYNLDFDFSIGLIYGSGTVTVNGSKPLASYESGSTLNISVTLSDGFTSVNWFESPNTVTPIATTASFIYTMPERDVTITGQMVGTYTPVNTYGLKYFAEYGSIEGNRKRLEILKDGYNPAGGNTEIKVGEITFGWGNTGDDPLKTIIGSYLDFEIFGGVDDFTEFIEGDALTWQVKYYENRTDTVPFFVGYISPDFITILETQTTQRQQFTAIDGLKGLDAIRANTFWQFGVADQSLYGALNQIFKEQRKVNMVCQLWENRMPANQAPFSNFDTPYSAIFKDGKDVEFKDGTRIINERLFLKDVIERIVNPFLCRVFLWRNEFWIVRIPEIAKSELKVNRIFPLENYTITDNTVDVSCVINNPERTARRVFTEFTTSLNLGVLDYSSQGSVLNTINTIDDWTLYPLISNSYKLRNSTYVGCKPTGQPSSVPTSSIALVQYNTDRESMKIWATTTTAGLADPNISYVSFQPSYGLAQETANTISLSFEFASLSISSSDPKKLGSYKAGIMLKVGTKYLRQINETQFDFIDNENVVLIDIPSINAWHSYTISNLLVPIDGVVEFRLYQLIAVGTVVNQYTIEYRKLNLTVEENKSLSLAKYSVKAITNDKFSNVHEEYNTYIGDTETNNSTSAIVLKQVDRPHSVSWTRDGVESLPLMDLIVQDLANLKGRSNQRILGTVERKEIRPYQRIEYNGKYYMIISIKLDTYRNRWECELFQL